MSQVIGNVGVMEKTVLTLEEILNHYFYKEWVQEELRDVGEAISGDKDELIERFLNSRKIRKRSVDEIAVDLLTSLRVKELRQIAEQLGTRHQSKHSQILKAILGSVAFEPFVRDTTRYCSVCLKETTHELHFGVDWQADHFKCEICEKVSSVRPSENESRGDQLTPQQVVDFRKVEPIHVPETKTASAGEHVDAIESPFQESPRPEKYAVGEEVTVSENHKLKTVEAKPPAMLEGKKDESDSISHQALAWAIALGGVGVFLAVSIPISLAYGWILGIVSGLVSTILAGTILILSRRYWVKGLLKLVR